MSVSEKLKEFAKGSNSSLDQAFIMEMAKHVEQLEKIVAVVSSPSFFDATNIALKITNDENESRYYANTPTTNWRGFVIARLPASTIESRLKALRAFHAVIK